MIQELQKEINWEIQEKEIFLNESNGYNQIEGYKAITRDDTNKILAVAKQSYHPMTNSEFTDIVSKVQEISGFELIGYNAFKEGRRVLGFLKNNREDFYIGSHKIEDYFLLGNSFDSSSAFFQGVSTILIRCQNQFSQINVMNKIRHTKSIGKKLDEFYAYLDFYFNKRKKLYENFERMGNITLTEDIREQMINFVLDVKEVSEKEISTRKQNQIDFLRANILSESKALGENMWGAFNGVTKMTSNIESKNPVFGNVFGRQADINKKAYDFAKNQFDLVLN